MPAGRWSTPHIAIATGLPAPPDVAPPGAQHKCSSEPGGVGLMVKTGFHMLNSDFLASYLVVRPVGGVQPQGLGEEFLLLNELQRFRKTPVPC